MSKHTYNDAVRWYNREARRAKICGIDLELAKEAAARFGVAYTDVLAALGWKESNSAPASPQSPVGADSAAAAVNSGGATYTPHAIFNRNSVRDDTFFIVYPEKRVVSAQQIRTWYEDAVANGDYGIELGLNDPREMAATLSSCGHITLARKR